MPVSADTLALLVRAGLSGEALVEVVRSMEADAAPMLESARSSGAERQRRWRARHAEAVSGDVTRDVTGDASPRDTDPLPLPPLPQTPSPPTPSPGEVSTRGRESCRDDRADAVAFGRFWEAYPRKVAKPEAAKAFAKALRRVNEPDAAVVIQAGLHRHLPAWADTEPDLVPHPTTWLNQDRFNDQPSTRRQGARDDRPHRSSPGHDRLSAIARAMHEGISDGDLGGASADALAH